MNNSEIGPKIQILQFYLEHIANVLRLGSIFRSAAGEESEQLVNYWPLMNVYHIVISPITAELNEFILLCQSGKTKQYIGHPL